MSTAFYYQNTPWHDRCLLEHLQGHRLSKNARQSSVTAMLNSYGTFPNRHADYNTPDCSGCHTSIAPGRPTTGYSPGPGDTHHCNVCNQPGIQDTWQHSWWHAGHDFYVRPELRTRI